jgi:hypothetical protein
LKQQAITGQGHGNMVNLVMAARTIEELIKVDRHDQLLQIKLYKHH